MFPLAQVVAEPAIGDLITQVLTAVQQKNWWLVGVLAIIGFVALVRKLSGRVTFLKFFTTDRGGAILALLSGVAGSLVVKLATGGIDLQAAIDGVILGISSAGGYSVVKKILFPADAAAPAPAPIEEVVQ